MFHIYKKNNSGAGRRKWERRQKQTDGEQGQKWHPNIAAAVAEMPAGDSVSDATEPKVRCMLVKLSCRQHFPEVIVLLINIHLNLISFTSVTCSGFDVPDRVPQSHFFPHAQICKKHSHTSLKNSTDLLRLSAPSCFSSHPFCCLVRQCFPFSSDGLITR